MQVFQPSNQIKLTNVSIVKYRRAGKRFEIACYKNKVLEWRNGVETDLDEVVQISSVFTNVSKGQVAPNGDLQKAFGTTDTETIIKEVLKKGDLQVGEKERHHQMDALYKDIIQIISEKCVDPESRRPYTTNMIDKAVQEMGYSVAANKSAKSQALDVIRLLRENGTINIARARMRVRVTCSSKDAKRLKEKLHALLSEAEEEDYTQDEYELVAFIDPGAFRQIGDLLRNETRGRGQVELLDMHETQAGEE